ncbi:MAG: tetratricopeptide repeat protein [Chloroflexi bacterium]|nr:MAG: tetratricopeptide repeat protein [Chloroflexota bacterium]
MAGRDARPRGTRLRRPRGVAVDAAALKRARLDAGLSLAEVAGDRMTRQAVHLFETGRARPTLVKLRQIVERLGNISIEAALADVDEDRLAELDEQQRFPELGTLATRLLRDVNSTKRARAIATYYAGRAVVNQTPARALALFRRARRLLLRVAEPWLAAEAMDWEAAALYLMQDPSAMEVGAQALERYRALPDRLPHVEARILEHLGTYRLQRGEHSRAIERYREALEVAGARLELARLANIYHGLAEGCRQAGEMRLALDYMERAVHFYRTEHDVRGPVSANLARAENDYGVHLMRMGRWERAEEMIRAALDHYEEIGVAAGRTHALLSMGELHQLRNRPDEAVDWTVQAIEHAQRLGETVAQATAYQQLGELWAAMGDAGGFEACFDRALEILDRAALPERTAECVARQARLRAAAAAGRRRQR